MFEFIIAPLVDSESDSLSENERPPQDEIFVPPLKRSYSDPLDLSLDAGLSSSLEDLIATFDHQIYKCFQDLSADTAHIAPVPIRSELLKEGDWWNSVSLDEPEHIDTKSKKEHTIECNNRLLFAFSGNESPSLRSAEGLLQEIHEMMDYSDNNADFEGIEESFYDSDLSETVKDSVVNFQCIWSNKEGSIEWETALNLLSLDALKMLTNDMKARIRTLSDCLLIHLASRDELEFEREVRDRFMLLLQGVQRKKREFARTLVTQRHNAAQLRQKNRGSSRWSWNGNWGTIFRNQRVKGIDSDLQISCFPKNNNDNNDNDNNNNNTSNELSQISVKEFKSTKFSFNDGLNNCRTGSFKENKSKIENKSQTLDATLKYLSTTIPFNRGVSSINVHHLQIFNKILLAILQENSKLDNFLTEYILNVYTPSIDCNNVYSTTDDCNNYEMDLVCQ